VQGQIQASSAGVILGSLSNHTVLFHVGGVEKARLNTDGSLQLAGGTGPKIIVGAVTLTPPTVAAPPGSLFLNTNGGAATTLWVKESGSGTTGWVPK
jgi:hypothetical protein